MNERNNEMRRIIERIQGTIRDLLDIRSERQEAFNTYAANHSNYRVGRSDRADRDQEGINRITAAIKYLEQASDEADQTTLD